jgi:hypothetical protein
LNAPFVGLLALVVPYYSLFNSIGQALSGPAGPCGPSIYKDEKGPFWALTNAEKTKSEALAIHNYLPGRELRTRKNISLLPGFVVSVLVQQGERGDPGLADVADYDIWAANVGQTAGTPEPATMSLLALGGPAMLRRRK